MSLWKDGMANKNMIGLDNHTKFTESPKKHEAAAFNTNLYFFPKLCRGCPAPPFSGHICWVESGCTGHFPPNPPSSPHGISLPFETNGDLVGRYGLIR